MKRLIQCIIMLLTAVSIQAARALSEPFTVQQPDGSWLTLTCYGDEHANWLTTDDGVLVAYRQGAYYVAAIEDNGKLTCSNLLAHSRDLRQEAERQLCKAQQQRQSHFYEQACQSMETGRRAQVTNTSYFPHKDQPKCLAILVNFQDVKFTSPEPLKQFEQYFNGDTQENLGQNEDKNLVGVKKYFEQCSGGKFSPQFTVVGPVTLSENMEYYGGSEEGSSSDARFDAFCKESIAMVDDEVDFAEYDNDGDGCAELVCLIYAGYGQSNNSSLPNTIWPKCSYRGIDTKDNVKVNYVNCNAELRKYYDPEKDPESAKFNSDINGIGVFVHEFSHGMGLPDLYATNENARINNQTPEFWDLMDYGEYANNGYAPVVYSAWEQEAMGWITIEELTKSQTIFPLTPLVKGGKAYKFSNGGDTEEWFHLENVQNYDKENRVVGHVYSHGLLVWHIAYAKSTVNMTDYPNNTASQPRVSIVPADGEVINGYLFGNGKPYTQAEYINSLRHDAFPYTHQEDEQDVTTNSVTAEQQLPNYKFYKSATGETVTEEPVFSLTNITQAPDGLISFDFNDGVTPVVHVVESVKLNEEKLELEEEDTYQMQATILPTDAEDQRIYWSAVNELVASVDGEGLVTAVGEGVTLVIGRSLENPALWHSCEVTVTHKEPSGIVNVKPRTTTERSVFDLQGRPINGTPSRHGIYIVQGKKVVR